MSRRHSINLIIIGGCLLVGGWLMIFAQVIRLLQPSFFLSFFGYGACIVGLGLGITGAFMARADRRRHL